MNVQFKKGVLKLCVLVLTSKKDRYGYELVEEISKIFVISEGTIYSLLSRLTKEGLFFTYLKESGKGPPRKYYRLTKKGVTLKEELILEWKQLMIGVDELINEHSY